MPSDEDEADDDELAEIIRDRQVKAARAKGTSVPLLLDPKLILEYIDLWHKDPNTPMPDFKLTPGQSHMLTHFIQEEKWKYVSSLRLMLSPWIISTLTLAPLLASLVRLHPQYTFLKTPPYLPIMAFP